LFLSNFQLRAPSCRSFGGCFLTRLQNPVIGMLFRKLPSLAFSIGAACSLLSPLAFAQAPAPPPSAVASPPAPRPQPRFTILLDAAHGGDDSGGQIGTAVAEKTVTLALSVRLRSLLTARGFSVVTTREGNITLDADARAQIANHALPAACLVLHATQSGSGVHLFTSAIAPTQPTRFLAWKTAQSAYVTRSLRLAGVLNAAFAKAADAVLPATLARATLPGLDSLACPAVVVELAPERASDGSIAADVTDPTYQTQVVETIAGAMMSWKTEAENEPNHESGSSAGGRQP
jgi:N-acetylmuramoyl-L-alanine amidase